MKESVLVHVLNISRRGEKQSFQVKLPEQIYGITGIEVSVRMRERMESVTTVPIGGGKGEASVPKKEKPLVSENKKNEKRERPSAKGLKAETLIGELRLQGFDGGELFFSEEVNLDNTNIHHGNFLNVESWAAQWTHIFRYDPHPVKLFGTSTIISGFYKDIFGERTGRNKNYQVVIYLWYDKEGER